MRILIAGAGATGGAFGTRLVEAGRDVTFLVRPERAEALRASGLRFIGPDEDRTNPVAVTTAEELAANPIPADLVLIAVKASGLDQVIDDIRPAIGPDTLIIPFLNGMAH
ncbi:oxidoreductase, partial [Burkholderia multivorans]